MLRVIRIIVTLVCLFFFWPLYLLVLLLTAVFNAIEIHKFIALFHTRKKNRVLFWDSQPPTQSGNFFRSHKWCEKLNNGTNNIIAFNWYDLPDPAFSYITNNNILCAIFYAFFAYWRFLICFIAAFFNVIIIRREFLLYYDFGGLFMEKFLYSLNHNLIYDVDDKMYELKNEPKKLNWNTKYIQQQDGLKATHMLSFYKYFFPASDTLINKIKEEQSQLPDSHIQKMPMCIDYKREDIKFYSDYITEPLIIGWYGAPRKIKPLEMIINPLNNLYGKYDFKLCIVCSEPLKADCKFPVEFRPWSIYSEDENLRYFDIAVGPQYNNISEKRQASTFKVVQYMGAGLVTLASDLSYNRLLIQTGINGFLVKDTEWEKTFEYIFTHREDFQKIGLKAYETVYKQHSYDSIYSKMINFLNFVADQKS